MTEINEYLWESLYALKAVYDHDPNAPVLSMYRDVELDGDYVYEIAMNSLDAFFTDTRNYYDEEKDYDVYVFFDPLITKTWELCEEYERRRGLLPDENDLRKSLMSSIDSALFLQDYSYDYRIYADTGRRGGCRIVLLMDMNFSMHCMIPGALAETHAAFRYYKKQLEAALNSLPGSDTDDAAQVKEKEAA